MTITSHSGFNWLRTLDYNYYSMIEYEEGAPEPSKQKRDFLVKKPKRLNELHLGNLASGLINSEPVTPSKHRFGK